MVYAIFKVLVRFSLQLFFKRIYISGIEHIDISKPQIIASNHPNGFLEPLVMACFFPKPLHFLVRGDVFENKFLKPILIATNQIPIYRFRDGFSKLRENSTTMDASAKVLGEYKNLLIFVEGGTKSIKMLRPLQKGVIRIAEQSLAKYPNLPLEIVPVGINFTYPSQFLGEVMLQIGKPIPIQIPESSNSKSNKLELDNLLDDIYSHQKPQVIHLDNEENITLFEDSVTYVRLVQPSTLLPVVNFDDTRYIQEKKWADRINLLSTYEKSLFKQDINSLQKQSAQFKNNGKSIPTFTHYLALFIGFVPALIGLISFIIPTQLGFQFTKAKVKAIEFRASVLFVSVLVLCLVWLILLMTLLSVFHFSLWFVAIMFVCGIIAKQYISLINSYHFFINSKNYESYFSKAHAFVDKWSTN